MYAEYKSTYRAAAADFTLHAALFALCIWGSFTSVAWLPLVVLMHARTFMIFHDCTHDSYTPSKWLNTVLAHVLGVFVFTPPLWGNGHAIHHLTNGNPENKYHYKFNESVFHTTDDVRKMTPAQRRRFRILHHPLVLFPLGSFAFFLVLQRFLYLLKKIVKGNKYPISGTEVATTTFIHTVGLGAWLYVLAQWDLAAIYAGCFTAAGMIGLFLFHVQHTYNPAYIETNETWTQQKSGLMGSSFLQVPGWLKYFTMGIEYHHIHHMNSKIPGYHLQEYHEAWLQKGDRPALATISMQEAYQNIWLRVYDPASKRYLTIQQAEELVKTD